MSIHPANNSSIDYKWTLIIDQSLPIGLVANTAAVLALTLGKLLPEVIGEDMTDADNFQHLGITRLAMPILKGDGQLLSDLRSAVRAYEEELMVVDLTSDTLNTRSNEEYAARLKNTQSNQIEYLGLALCGRKKLVNKFTGHLGLLR